MEKQEYVNLFAHVAGVLWDGIISKSNDIPIKIVYTDNYNGGEDNKKLEYEKDGDSGFDLRAESNSVGGYQIGVGGTIVIPVGIKVAVPNGSELQVRTRSGSPLKRGFVVANSPGTVDSGYRGVVGVICHNISDQVVEIECGERIAQGVVCPVYKADFVVVDTLDETERGEGAYNSTGIS